MVDPISGVSPSQGVQSNKNNQNRAESEKPSNTGASQPVDEVSISKEALSLAEARSSSDAVKNTLADRAELSLGLDPAFDEAV